MNSPIRHKDTAPGAADEAMRQSLQKALGQTDRSGLQTLQDHIVAQWAQRSSNRNIVGVGPLGRLQLVWVERRMQLSAATLVVVLMAGLQLVRTHAEPNIDDLMEPDVLALMAMGEL